MILLLSLLSVFADEAPVCPKCEVIREYNAAHPENNYYWYEDYLKDQKEKSQNPELACRCNEKDKKEPQEREDHLAGCGCGGKKKAPKEKTTA